MFTGIIVSSGKVIDMVFVENDLKLTVSPGSLSKDILAAGESISVNGVCLTLLDDCVPMRFDVSQETLSRTELGGLSKGDVVNLEPALTAEKALGGHLVSGHVDGVATIHSIVEVGLSYVFTFTAPRSFARFIAEKGSVTIDGISLTVNTVEDQNDSVCFSVNIVPHTLENTNLGSRSVGHCVHFEIDQIARYVDRILTVRQQETQP